MSPREFTLHCADNARTPLYVIGEVTLPLALGDDDFIGMAANRLD